MNLSEQLGKHMRDVFFGGNWTTSNVRDNVKDVTWQQAITKVDNYNTIAKLVYHMSYFVFAVSRVLEGGPLDSKDEYSFNHPPINSQEDWDNMLQGVWAGAECFSELIAKLPEDKLWADFVDAKYGTYYRNIQGIIEHTHYHLGQVAIIKKMVVKQG